MGLRKVRVAVVKSSIKCPPCSPLALLHNLLYTSYRLACRQRNRQMVSSGSWTQSKTRPRRGGRAERDKVKTRPRENQYHPSKIISFQYFETTLGQFVWHR